MNEDRRKYQKIKDLKEQDLQGTKKQIAKENKDIVESKAPKENTSTNKQRPKTSLFHKFVEHYKTMLKKQKQLHKIDTRQF